MRQRAKFSPFMSLALLASLSLPTVSWSRDDHPRPLENSESVEAGRRLYREACSYCHGKDGNGDGPVAYFLSRGGEPRPRGFGRSQYKFRSTESGMLPTDQDLFRFVSRGRPGFMPGYRALSASDRWRLVYYVKSLSPRYESEAAPEPIEIGQPVPATVQSVSRGEDLYGSLQCWQCHGLGGRGDGPSAPTLQAETGLGIPSTDLTRPSSFGNGSTPQDVYRSVMLGLNGVPMPSYNRRLPGDDAWHLVNYILSLDAEGR